MKLQAIIDKALEEREKTKSPQGDYWRPSMLGRCERLQYWSREGKEASNPIDARTLRVFQAGNLFHNFIQQYLPPHQCEVNASKEDVSGRADIVTDDTIIDIKSQHSKSFWYASREGFDIKKEKFTNWLQVTAYAWMLDKPKIQLVFVSKDDLCISEFHDLTEKWLPELEKELKTLRGFWERKELPPKNPKAYNGKDCQYCCFETACEGGKKWEN